MSSTAGQGPPSATAHIPAEEQMRRQGIWPIKSVAELVFLGVFDSDEELSDFLADLYASRRAGTP
jgi:hypothetical protein